MVRHGGTVLKAASGEMTTQELMDSLPLMSQTKGLR